jgi:hypothetical protein
LQKKEIEKELARAQHILLQKEQEIEKKEQEVSSVCEAF